MKFTNPMPGMRRLVLSATMPAMIAAMPTGIVKNFHGKGSIVRSDAAKTSMMVLRIRAAFASNSSVLAGRLEFGGSVAGIPLQ